MANTIKIKSLLPKLYHPAVVWLLRIIVGATFVISGFSKGVDPWGSVIKINEYLAVWGWDIPSALVTVGAFVLIGMEFVFGMLLMMGCYRRVSVWILLLMMAFMLPLTLYIAVANPVADCGCFGDFLVVSNTVTFVKNILLTLALVYLAIFNTRLSGIYFPYVQWVVGGLLTLYIMVVAFVSYNVQPLIDFRRFAPGTSLLSASDDTDDEDEPVFEFVYERDGERKAYSIDELPDSTWTFVERHLVSGSEKESDGFTIIQDGEDIAPDIISEEGEQFIITIPDIKRVDPSYTYLINELNDFMTARGGSLVALVSSDESGIEWWRDISMASYPIYNAEPTLIKELARGHAALVYLKDGVVQWKRTLSSISYTFVTEASSSQLIEELDPEPALALETFTGVTGVALLVLLFFDRSGKLVAWLIRRRKRKRARQKQEEDI